MALWQFFSTAVRLKSTFPLCSCEPQCPNLNLPTICRSQLRSMRRFNAKSALNHLPRRQLKRPRRNRLSLLSATTRTNGISRLPLSSKPIALRQKRLCPITAGSATHSKKSGKHLSSSIEATAISRASIVLGVPAYTVRDWNRLYKENRFLQSGSTLDTKSLWEETADEG